MTDAVTSRCSSPRTWSATVSASSRRRARSRHTAAARRRSSSRASRRLALLARRRQQRVPLRPRALALRRLPVAHRRVVAHPRGAVDGGQSDREVPALLAAQGAPCHRPHTREVGGGGDRHPRAPVEGLRDPDWTRRAKRGRERGEQLPPVARRSLREEGDRRRGPAPQERVVPRPWAPRSQAAPQQSHHDHRRREGGRALMGQKTHPNGFRLGFTKTWNAKWYANTRGYSSLVK